MKILADFYPYFQDLVTHYKIRSDTSYWDIACFLMYTKLKAKKPLQVKWVNFWKKTTRKIRTHGNLVYTVPTNYYHFSQLDDTEVFFRSFLETKLETKREISWDDYIWMLFKKRDMLRPIFTKMEFQLFRDILAVQSIANKNLKETAWKNITNLSKYKRRVLDKGVLFQGFTLNSLKLSLANYNILLTVPISEAYDFHKLFSSNSYLNFNQIGSIGCQNILLNYIVPDAEEAKEDLEILKTILERKYSSCTGKLFLLERKTKLVSFNFSSYRYKNGKWNFFPHLQRLFLEQFPPKEFRKNIPIREEFTDFSREKLKLSRTLLNFINTLLNTGHISKKKIAKKSGLNNVTVKKYLQYLFDEQIIKTRINPMVVFGLASIVLLLNYPKSMHSLVHSHLSIFVETYTETYQADNEEGIIAVLRCPKENVLTAIEILRKIFKNHVKELFIVDQFYSKRFQFPVERYDPLFQKWKYSKNDLLGDLENG